ncbi:MAG: amidohydrolase [Sphingobacteriales bacterium 17-39-43]|uniref:amidohydrolase n=1 Tax=Daejeonella sp. TaxID=2805397 RepID=UPI000BC485C2|nr:amidohydrolase [Daejeonella sp.]OYZ32573.1 MAG: amidohydrolase [Sphingobacteriales bacterium 16-39-50]OZA25936.1 MAG: amidohydrolase [Sphingobacteriales bacterium 17-39-43]HQT21864.1 amidohydrolase [Daejeonella sp.]HQT57171.1 amidohydrolase [Daejeonella sp.]
MNFKSLFIPLRANTFYFLILFLFICINFTACKTSESPTLAIINARIWTGDEAQPWAEAIAVKGETIIHVGSSEEVRKMLDDGTKLIDAKGQMLVPGFNDAHVHFIDGGFGLSSVSLRDAKTKQEFIDRIAAFVKTVPPGTWILNGDWDHTNWGGELPQASWIDSVSADHPVFVQRLDGHMGLANSAAMKLAKISASTADVEGGSIIRNKNRMPEGIFKDNAMGLIGQHISDPSHELKDRALEAAMKYVASNGVTSVQSMGGWQDLEVYRRAAKKGILNTRIYAVVPLSSWKKLKEEVEKSGKGDSWLKIGGLKGFVDGSLGSHTAAFKQPFSDTPTDSGFLVTPVKELYEQISAADKAGLQVMVHAIGDKAIEEQLNIFEIVEKDNGKRDRRFRIEHAQHIAPEDLSRFKTLNVIASMQPYHAIDDGKWAEKVIGPERIKTTYAFKSLLDNQAVLAFGSDWFVAPPTPTEGIYAAVTRRTLDDKNPEGWVPEQKMNVEQALKAYTYSSAYASFDENNKGILKKGYLADFVILDQNLFDIKAEAIRDVKVMKTFTGGKLVFERDEK